MDESDMSTLDDRIRALDPFAGAPYEHATANAMVERITTAAAARPRRRLRSVLLAPMGAVAAAGLAAGLLVTAGSTAPTLSAIHVAGVAQGVQSSPTPFGINGPGINGTEAGGPIVLDQDWLGPSLGPLENGYTTASSSVTESPNLYLAATQFSTAAPALAAVRVVGPTSPTGVLAAIASTLRVDGAVKHVAASAWRLGVVSGPHGAAGLYRSTSGLYEFAYVRGGGANASAPCSRGPATGAVDADRFAMGSTTSNLLASLGLHYELAAPTFQVRWSRAGRAGCDGITTLREPILVDGVSTGQAVQTTFDPSGRLVAASFPVFMLGGTAPYPLVSPATAASTLVRSSPDLGVLERGHGKAATPTGSAPSSRTGGLRDLLIVELRSSSIALRAFTTTSGATWLLPVYTLSGDGYTDVAASPTAWSGDVLATAAPLVRIAGASVNQARVFDEQRRSTGP
jgi:hypothetical protein